MKNFPTTPSIPTGKGRGSEGLLLGTRHSGVVFADFEKYVNSMSNVSVITEKKALEASVTKCLSLQTMTL